VFHGDWEIDAEGGGGVVVKLGHPFRAWVILVRRSWRSVDAFRGG
jgi:hypothetical protein